MTTKGKENKEVIEAEMKEGGFTCCGCGGRVSFSETIGTKHRNHCSKCLSSKHLDKDISGDRAAECGGCMEPVGLTFKQEGMDKYGKPKKGELMIVHRCGACGAVSINRLAADDEEGAILKLFSNSKSMDEGDREKFFGEGIRILDDMDKEEVFIQLFGKGNHLKLF